jgi:glutamate/tyrosine decarboxylase-like PLP-dependent enzyme
VTSTAADGHKMLYAPIKEPTFFALA